VRARGAWSSDTQSDRGGGDRNELGKRRWCLLRVESVFSVGLAVRGATRRVTRFGRLFGARSIKPVASGQRTRLLVTGSGGRVGTVLRRGLADAFELVNLDSRRVPGVDAVVDMRKLDKIRPHFDGVDTVIDLAAVAREITPWDVVLENNVPATINALEAARLAGVRRFVFASSNHVTGMYEHDEPYRSILANEYEGLDPASVPLLTEADPIRPDGPYAVGKALGEAAGRFYSDTYGLSVICLRIGHVNLDDVPKNSGHYSTLLSHRDLVELVKRAILAPPSIRFAIYYGVSANTWRIWDLERARAEIGYVPRDDAEDLRPNGGPA
jgi:dTDP-4-dehydrorhamnose reductase